MDIPPHLVANNKDILELAKVRPSSTKNMLKVDGISVVKVKRIGEVMVTGNLLFKLFFNHRLRLRCMHNAVELRMLHFL